jgi:hypothetical protein
MARRYPGQQDLLGFVECGQRRRVAVEHLPRLATAIQIGQGSIIIQRSGHRVPAGLERAARRSSIGRLE